MADEGFVLVAFSRASGGAMLVLRVDGATGDLVGSRITARLFDPFHGRELPLLAEQAGPAIPADRIAALAAQFAPLLAAGAEVARRRFIPNDSRREALPLAPAGAALPRRGLVPTNRIADAVVFDPLSEYAGRQAWNAALLAVDAEGIAARAAQLAYLLVAVAHRHDLIGNNSGPEGLLFVLAGAAVPQRGLIPTNRTPHAVSFDTLAEHAGRQARNAAVDAEQVHSALLAAGGQVPRCSNRLREVLLLAFGLGVIPSNPIPDAAATAPRGYLSSDAQFRGEAHQVGHTSVAPTNGPAACSPVLVDGDRGLFPASTVFCGGIVVEQGDTAVLLRTPEAQAEERVMVRVFTADHGLQIAATEDQGLGRPLFIALVVSIGTCGDQNTPDVVFEVEALTCGRSIATCRGRRSTELIADFVVVRVYIAAADGSLGPFIAATADQFFGRSILAALAVPSGDRGDCCFLHVEFEVEVLRRGLSVAAADGDHRVRHLLGRGSLVRPCNPTGHGNGLAAATPSYADSSRPDAVAPVQARAGTKGFKIRKKKANHEKRKVLQTHSQKLMKFKRLEKIASQKLMKFRNLLSDFVWFAVPSVLLFYPRQVEGSEDVKDNEPKPKPHSMWLQVLGNSEDPSTEKTIVITVFVMFLSIWIIAYLVATLGKGKRCVRLVGTLSFITVISIVAYVDYILSKSLPQNKIYSVAFVLHFAVMVGCITQVWRKYVKETSLQLVFSEIQGFVHKIWTWLRRRTHPVNNHLVDEDSLRTPLIGPERV